MDVAELVMTLVACKLEKSLCSTGSTSTSMDAKFPQIASAAIDLLVALADMDTFWFIQRVLDVGHTAKSTVVIFI